MISCGVAPASGFSLSEGNADVEIAVRPLLDWEGPDIIPEREQASARLQIELPVVPVADQDAVPDAALGQRVAKARTSVVGRQAASLVEEDSQMGTVHGAGPADPLL